MILIYLQETIDYMFKVDKALIANIEQEYGVPEIINIIGSKGDNIRYYKWDNTKEKTRGK